MRACCMHAAVCAAACVLHVAACAVVYGRMASDLLDRIEPHTYGIAVGAEPGGVQRQHLLQPRQLSQVLRIVVRKTLNLGHRLYLDIFKDMGADMCRHPYCVDMLIHVF